jgi:hypothetical protein
MTFTFVQFATSRSLFMTTIKSIATLAASLLAASAFAAGEAPDTKCGAGSCGKKTSTDKKPAHAKDAACSKKDAACGKKDAACSKKDAASSKKPASAPSAPKDAAK